MRHFLKRNTVFFFLTVLRTLYGWGEIPIASKAFCEPLDVFPAHHGPFFPNLQTLLLARSGPLLPAVLSSHHLCNELLSTLVPCFCRCTGSLYWGEALLAAPDAHFLLPPKLYVPVYTMTISIGTGLAYGIFNNCVCLHLIVKFYILFKSKNGPYIAFTRRSSVCWTNKYL